MAYLRCVLVDEVCPLSSHPVPIFLSSGSGLSAEALQQIFQVQANLITNNNGVFARASVLVSTNMPNSMPHKIHKFSGHRLTFEDIL